MAFIQRYLFIAMACVFLLAGMQLPNLADQYAKRVDASLREVTQNFEPFVRIANEHKGGSVEALIRQHRESPDAEFRKVGDAIERMHLRKRYLEAEHQALQAPLHRRLWHILTRADPELRTQTLRQYSATVPLNQEALLAGGTAMVAALALAELLLMLMRKVQQRLKARVTRFMNEA